MPGGRWAWFGLIPVLLSTVLALAQVVESAGDEIFWWIMALVGVAFSIALVAHTVLRLSRRSRTAVRVDDYGLHLPEHGPVAWAQVEDVTTVVADKKRKVWWVLLRDGTRVETGFAAKDPQLRDRWEQHRPRPA